MPGERLGRWSLRLDAIYCVVVGAVVALSSWTGLDPLLMIGLGTAVVVWGLFVGFLSTRPLRPALRLVAVANVVAALALAAVSTALAGPLLVLAALAVAIDVAAFAAAQGVAHRRLARSAGQAAAS